MRRGGGQRVKYPHTSSEYSSKMITLHVVLQHHRMSCCSHMCWVTSLKLLGSKYMNYTERMAIVRMHDSIELGVGRCLSPSCVCNRSAETKTPVVLIPQKKSTVQSTCSTKIHSREDKKLPTLKGGRTLPMPRNCLSYTLEFPST